MEYRVLGPLEVLDGERSLPLAGAKQRALLALLLLNANQMLSRDRLIDDSGARSRPRRQCNRCTYTSRVCASCSPPARCVTRPPGYQLELEPDELDLRRFERLLAEGRKALAHDDPGRASSVLHDALALWRGPALAEFAFEPFAQVEIGRLEELRLAAVEERVEADLALGRHAELIGELEALIAESPHRERFRSQLMLALYRSGRQAEALEAYHDARATLDELGIEPSERLRELERAILTHEATLVATPPLFGDEIMLPGPLRVSSPFPFVGRERELTMLRSLLDLAEDGESGQVAVVGGEAGSGKTRLVRELARDAADRGTLVLYGGSDPVVNAPYQPFVEALEFLVRVSDPTALDRCLGTGRAELARILPDLSPVPLPASG